MLSRAGPHTHDSVVWCARILTAGSLAVTLVLYLLFHSAIFVQETAPNRQYAKFDRWAEPVEEESDPFIVVKPKDVSARALNLTVRNLVPLYVITVIFVVIAWWGSRSYRLRELPEENDRMSSTHYR